MEGRSGTLAENLSETIRYSGVSLRNKNSLDPTSLIGTDNYVWYFQLKTRNTTLSILFLLHQLHNLESKFSPEDLAAHAAWVKGQKEVAVLMLLTMDLDIQRNLAHLGAYDMLQELKAMFSKQAEQELLQTVREFHTCKQEEGQSVSTHVLKMKGYIDNLERLGQPVGKNLAVLIFVITNQGLHGEVGSFSKDNLVYFMAVPRDGIFEIDMSCSNTNDSSMYAITNKRAKINLDSSLLWHCRLGHISKKRIEKLQHDGLLSSTDIESLGNVFHACLVFQREVENQLGKTIKSLVLIVGGIYGQEFFGSSKRSWDHCLIALLPTRRKTMVVSEREKMKHVDMVRSMMSQTTLPKSFWDYALETAARILNMVPSKKVDKTPYEIWHGQAPKLSYLRVWGCEAFVKHDTLTKPDKLDPRSFKCIFVGYPKETMGYSFYSPSENKVFVARNAEFFESKLLDLKSKWECGMNLKKFKKKIHSFCHSRHARSTDSLFVLYIDTEDMCIGISVNPPNYRAAWLDPDPRNKNLEKILYGKIPEWTIPMHEKLKLSKSQVASTPCRETGMQIFPTLSAIGSIMYAVRSSSDVAFAQNIDKAVSTRNPGNLRNDSSGVSCYTVAGYLTDADTLSRRWICVRSKWRCEYIAAFDAIEEAVWISVKFISGLGICPHNLKKPYRYVIVIILEP
ncbi:zinc finger, CCHC-type containing protein [Tanacetum coccineum]